jgi:hypothetical protein
VSDTGRRLLVVLTLILVFGGIAVVDRVAGRSPASPPSPGPPIEAARRVAPVGVESAAWYCAGGTSSAGGAVTLILVNTGPTPVRGTVTATSTVAPTSSTPVDVPARGSADVGLGTVTTGSAMAASVVLDGGGVAAWEQVDGPSGWSVAPCSAAMSPQWYFAHGSTRTGDGFALVLYNPGVTDAVSDVTLLTSTEGLASPAAFQGVDVGAGSLVVENVGDHVQDDPDIGAEVTALSGSLVACQLQSTSQSGQVGFSLLPGAPAAVRTSAFAQSTDPAGGGTTYYLLNPSTTPVAVSAAIGLQHGSASPIGIDVPAHAKATLDAGDQPRIPLSIPYSLTFSATGAGVVVGRALRAPSTASPPQVGMDEAVPVGPSRWVVPPVPQPGAGAWQLAVVDLADRPVSVTVRSLGRGGWRRVAAAPVEAVPGVPLLVGPDGAGPIGTAPIEVTASGAVVVQLEAVPAGGPAVVVVPALALG